MQNEPTPVDSSVWTGRSTPKPKTSGVGRSAVHWKGSAWLCAVIGFLLGASVIISIATGQAQSWARSGRPISESASPVEFYASNLIRFGAALIFCWMTSRLARKAKRAEEAERAIDRILARHAEAGG
jgi:hypothetical protein